MDNLIKTDTLFGKRVNLVGNISADLVLESLGKVYIKSRNKAQTLEELITSLVQEDPNTSTSKVKVVEGIENLDTSEFKDGTFVFDKLSNILYLYLDNDLLELINVAPEGDGYVKRSGDTMTGRLAIYVKNGPPLYVNSADLVENLNAQYLNGETADKFTRRHKDEKISGSWTFQKATTFDQGVRIYKDAVLHGSIGSPNFSSGFGGYGWRMDADTNTLTVDNLVVRKLMQVYELVVNKISATNGSLWVSNAGKVTQVSKLEIKPLSFFTNTSEYQLFCTGLEDDFIKLTTEITNESLEAEAFSTASGDNVITKECWSENTLRNAKFIFIKQKGGDYRGQYFDNTENTSYSIFPLFSEDFKFKIPFPIITRNSYDSYKQVQQSIQDTEDYIQQHEGDFNLQPYYEALAQYKEQADLNNFISVIQLYYKYFANGDYYLVTFDDDELPVFKPGDILRCQKWTYGGIKYYDAVVCNLVGSKYIIQLAPSFLDQKTTISYDSSLNPVTTQEQDSNNTLLYKSTSKYEERTNPLGEVEEKDSLVQIGNLWDCQRQNAVYITSTDDAAPYMDVLSDINRPDYSVIYYVPVYKTVKLYKTQYNLKTFVGYNNLVEIPYTGNYYIQNSNVGNFTCEYVCFEYSKVTYLAKGKQLPNIAGVKLLYYLNTIPDKYTILGEDTNNFYINLEDTGKILLEDGNGALILEDQDTLVTIASTRNVKARFGQLNGIKDELFPIEKQPYGYGLYGQNVFLTGEFYLSNGKALADIGKDAIAFAIASQQSGNAAINILRTDFIRADNLIKASHYSKGTLRTAGMYISENNGNPGMVIWGNKILFATTDLEFSGKVPPTMLLQDGKIRGKYLDVDEAAGTVNAQVTNTSFTIGGDTYTSYDPYPGTVRVFRQKIQNTASDGSKYYTLSDQTQYVRRFLINNVRTIWLLVNPDGYPLYKNQFDEYTNVSYPNFTFYDENDQPHSYSDGLIPEYLQETFVQQYTTPLKVWALQKDGKGNLGGSTLYWDTRGKVVVNGILYSTEGNIGGLRLGENTLYTLAKDANDTIFNPLRISTNGYGIEGEDLQIPYIQLSSMNTENTIRDRVVLNSRGLFYLGINTENNTQNWRDFMTCQVPAVLFSLTVIPIYIPDKGTWTLYARLSTSNSGIFQYAHINWGEGSYAINFDLMNGTEHPSWNSQRDWFIDLLYKGQVHFSVSGINAAESINTNAGLYDFTVEAMYQNSTIQFKLMPRQCIKANISYMFFQGGSKSFGPNNHIDYSNAFDYYSKVNSTTDQSLWLDANGNPRIDEGGLAIWDYSGNNPANYFKNVIVIDTSDDETGNWGGFNLTAIYLPTMDTRFIQRSDEKEDNYDPEKQEELNNVEAIRTRLINTYGTDGTSYTQAISTLNTKIYAMTSTQLANQQSSISSIESDIASMANTADNIDTNISLSSIQNLETSLEQAYQSILVSINALESGGGGGEVTPPSGDAITILSSEPTETSIDSYMSGIYNGPNAMLPSSAQDSVKIGTIQASGIGSNYGSPSVYGVYICDNGNMIDVSSTSNVVFQGSNSSGYEVYVKVLNNSNTVYKKVHLWIQFADVNELGYFSIYQAEGNGGTTPSSDTTLDGFISNITGSKINTVLTNVISASNTPNTYNYLQSGFNYVSGKSNATKSWMLANMLAELTPYVVSTTNIYQNKTETSGDTATNYFVNAAYSYGGLKLDYLSNEQVYMDRINGAVEYAKFKHANYSSSNSAADASRTELYNKGITQAVMVNDADAQSSSSNNERGNPYFSNDQAVHILPLIPNDYPSNSTSGADWQFTQSMINQYPTSSSLPNNYEALKDKSYDVAYLCKILDIPQTSNNLLYLWKCMDIGDAGGNQLKKSFSRPRPGTQHNLNGSNGFSIPSGGSIYLCDCTIELQNENDTYSDIEGFKDDYDTSEYDCSSTNNGTTYCDRDISSFTDASNTEGNPYRSYQSGHSHKAFMNLLLAIEAFGDSMNKDGYTSRTARINQYCLNRAVIRAHWKSDTIAGKFAISTQIGFLNGFNEFRQEIAKVL